MALPDEYTDIKGMVMGFEEKKVVLQIDGKRKSISANQYIIHNISTKILSDVHVTTCIVVIIDMGHRSNNCRHTFIMYLGS